MLPLKTLLTVVPTSYLPSRSHMKLVVLGDSSCFYQGLNRFIFFSRVLEIFLEILTNLSVSIFVICSSHSLLHLSTHSLIGWTPQDYLICWLRNLYIFV
jgi:hypothetical protein